jgi:hypothetical protein
MLSRKQALVKLDWDHRRKPDLGVISAKLERAGYVWTDVTVRRSPSGKGWHVILDVEPRPRSPVEVVALQAILGGDPWREAMQMNRARAFAKVPRWMRDAWNVLYQSDSRRARRLKL